jgi:hypothetical protein
LRRIFTWVMSLREDSLTAGLRCLYSSMTVMMRALSSFSKNSRLGRFLIYRRTEETERFGDFFKA